MKTTMKLLVAFVLLLAMFGRPAGAAAGDVMKSKGHGAFAFFSSIDASGCIVTSLDVSAGENLIHMPPEKVSPFAGAGVFLTQYDLCTDTPLLNASGSAPLSKGELQFAGTLKTATLTKTVSVFDRVSGTSFDVFIDLTWNVYELTRDLNGFKIHENGCHINVRGNTVFGRAQAVGTVSDGTTNFIPQPSISASIFSGQGVDVSHGCWQ